MSLFDRSAKARAERLSWMDLIVAVVILGVTGLAAAAVAVVSLLSVLMTDSCGTGGSGSDALVCRSGGWWYAAEAFLWVGLLAVFTAGAWWTFRRAGQHRLAGVAAFATFGGCLAVVLAWVGVLAVVSH